MSLLFSARAGAIATTKGVNKSLNSDSWICRYAGETCVPATDRPEIPGNFAARALKRTVFSLLLIDRPAGVRR
jgi:hypothetical protein